MTLGIGIDTGGTYTDAVIYDFDKREIVAKGKALTTKENLEIGIGNAIDRLPPHLVKATTILSLSTTLATNACVENKGGRAKLVLIGTSYKLLERIDAKTKYGLANEDVFCIDIPISLEGEIIDNPNWEYITKNQGKWFSDAQALAVAQVNALKNGAICEKMAKEKLTAKYKVPFVMASELANDLNVMERGATALLNARLLPIIEKFIIAVKNVLQERQLHMKRMIVRSDGSLMSDEVALIHPVKTILSGPAASIIGGRGLADGENSLIIDMGGTTTDISIVKNNEPAVTDGISIGGFKTQIKGVFIDTFGLGGDSRVTIENHKLVLNTRRVQPLCVAAIDYPQIKEELKKLIASNKTSTFPLYEFLYLAKKPQDLQYYSSNEINLIKKLKERPIMLGSGEIDLYNVNSERLEDEGIIMRCGLTPTDIMHIKGDFDKYDNSASILGAKYLLKMLPDYKEDNMDLNRLCDDIYDLVCRKLYENIVRVMLTNKHPKMFKKGISNQLLELIQQSWYDTSNKDFFGLHFDTQATLVGIGAPIHIFLPKVAHALGTECIIPKYAEVANAVGAIIADISASSKISISPNYTPDGITSYTVYATNGNKVFDTIEEAIEFAKSSAQNKAIFDAKKRGALGELDIDIKVIPKIAYSKKGTSIDLGTTVVASVTGRI
ncbi:hypothetical protein CS063_15365 [Sporanaerobium hydrogeniformans]|uniref:Uncharacterized protein n=1 Tax=Sporanaerobium hydrogeniformans TaxID=3072179 RepID=A0AC61D9U7_9FIRM|nr:hydantoinase/oxoprolinase family protein [Sporanaerobium hydrogeniformans]PHV69503.1 hypothetical protein CS063_15365 [Sporanaerobium hydrogeniformans]